MHVSGLWYTSYILTYGRRYSNDKYTMSSPKSHHLDLRAG